MHRMTRPAISRIRHVQERNERAAHVYDEMRAAAGGAGGRECQRWLTGAPSRRERDGAAERQRKAGRGTTFRTGHVVQ